jgi:hypothetical protein
LGRSSSYSGLEWHILGESNLKIYLLTFPRSGSVFFMMTTQVPRIERTHLISDIKEQSGGVIGIIRDPVESLTSYMAMLDSFNDPDAPGYPSKYDNRQKWINLYRDVYSYYVNNKCFLILNEDLRNHPEKTINGVLKNFNLFNTFSEKNTKKLPDEGPHLLTSKNTKNYAKIMRMLKKQNLEELYDLYNKAKERAIRF